MAAWLYPACMPSPSRPGSSYRWRKLRLFVLVRDAYTCQRCPEPHPLTTHDQGLPTHATLGHKDGRDWHLSGTTSWDPEDYQAECSHANYSDGASKGNALRAAPITSGLGASRRW
jgi:hypothetical protein